MTEIPKDRLRIVCTDRGTHPDRELGLVEWSPALVDGPAVWDATEDPTQYRPESLAVAGRKTNAGAWRPVHREGRVTAVTRADGGVTFRFRACPTCRKEYDMRDDKLSKIRRKTPSGSWDASLHVPVK